MSFVQLPISEKRNFPFVLSVLCNSSRSQFKQLQSPSNEYSLYYYPKRKISLVAQKSTIPKSKLLTNLQIYQWRSQTEFPIVKTILVQINQKSISPSLFVEATVYNQYCPTKLSSISQTPISQTIYLLKQSIIGFQRLFNRFGAFEIQDSMITINSKGHCKVWLNENLCLNTFAKRNTDQNKMVTKIICLMEMHAQESKSSKKLFQQLKNAKTFLNTLIMLQEFCKKNRIFVPSKLSNIFMNRESFDTNNTLFSKGIQTPISRLSLKYQENKIKQIENILKYTNQSVFSTLKRFSSQNAIKCKGTQRAQLVPEVMKVSGGETSHTNINKVSNLNVTPGTAEKQKRQHFLSEQKKPEIQKKRVRWIQQSSYLMDEEQAENPERLKKKKDLCKSQVNQSPTVKNCRKMSCKVSSEKKSVFPAKNFFFNRQSIKYQGFDDGKNHSIRIQEVDEQKFREEMSGAVLKNNGWVAKVSGLLDMEAKLEQSFQEGQQQVRTNRSIKLEQLQKLGANKMLMSILNQQLGSIF